METRATEVSDAAAVGKEAVPSPGLTAGWSGRRTATDPGRADGISPRLHGPEPPTNRWLHWPRGGKDQTFT